MRLFRSGFVPSGVCQADNGGGAAGGGGGGGGASGGGTAGGASAGAAPAGGAGGAGGGEAAAPSGASGGEGTAAPASEPAGASPAEPAAPATQAAPAWSIPEFKFDGWDGKLDALPEPLRPFAQGMHGYYDPQLRQAQRDVELYKSFVDDTDGTRAVEQLRQEHTGVLTQRDQQIVQLQAQVKQYNEHIQAQADEQAAAWYGKHQAKLKNPEYKARVVELIRGNVDADTAITLADQPKEIADLAMFYMNQGTRPDLAARLAMQDAGAPFGDGRSPASVAPVGGDAPFQASPALKDPDLADASVSPAEARKRAARLAFREVAGGD